MKDFLSLFFAIQAGLLFQAPTDFGGYLAPIFAVIATGLTVWSQIKQKKLENQIQVAQVKQTEQNNVLTAWERLFEKQDGEMRDIRGRLRDAEKHIRICDKATYKLVMQLIKNGIEVDLDAIMHEITVLETAVIQKTEIKKDG